MATKDEVRELIGKQGKAVPAHLDTKKQLDDYLEAVLEGYSDTELADAFPVPKEKQAEPPAPLASAPAPSFTAEQQALIDQMVNEAVKKTLGAVKAAPATTINVSQPKAKPVVYDSRNTGEDDFLPEPFAVFHEAGGHSFDKFRIGGRMIESPFSTLIEFERYEGPETQGVGMGQNLSHLCVHRTHSKTIRDMFLADERWGGEFWTTESKVQDEELERSILFAQISERMRSVNQTQLREMCMERKLPNSSLDVMRATVALYDTKKSMEQRQLDRAGVQALEAKKKLFAEA
jgi:hypothetical protein